MNMAIFVTWSNNTPENLAIGRQITRELNELFAQGQTEELGHVNEGYGNFDIDDSDLDKAQLKNTAEVLFGPNYPKLQQIKKKYDPQNVFSKWFAINPAP